MEPIDENGYYMKKFQVERLIDKKINEANERQKTKKPIPLVTLDGDIYLCNECESDLSPDDKYCHECGTKIDWSEEG